MASDRDLVEFIVGQIEDAGLITFKLMFGEYAIYSNGKVVALVCDNQLFIKATAPGKAFAGSVVEASPYPGAKPHFLVEDKVDDREWLGELVRITAKALPAPKPKRERKRAPLSKQPRRRKGTR